MAWSDSLLKIQPFSALVDAMVEKGKSGPVYTGGGAQLIKYAPPPSPATFTDHFHAISARIGPMTYTAGQDLTARMSVVAAVNEARRHCRIGKITMKG